MTQDPMQGPARDPTREPSIRRATAAQIVDATGRTVQVPDHIAHIIPAGPPAAVLLEAIAPDLMAGWPFPVSDDTRALLPPDAAKLPQIPRVTGHEDVSRQLDTLKPDLILDYGTVSPRYADLARATQQRTGIPTILLDGSLAKIPDTFRELGAILHRQDRGEVLAKFGEAGRMAGEFKWVHNVALDSKGNLYTAEVGTGRRAQKFNRTN